MNVVVAAKSQSVDSSFFHGALSIGHCTKLCESFLSCGIFRINPQTTHVRAHRHFVLLEELVGVAKIQVGIRVAIIKVNSTPEVPLAILALLKLLVGRSNIEMAFRLLEVELKGLPVGYH